MFKIKNLTIFNLIILISLILSIHFTLTSVRLPDSDGIVRFNTYKSLFTSEPIYTKFSIIQPLITKPIDAIFRFFNSSLSLDFAPSHIEVFLILFLILICLSSRTNKKQLILVMTLLPLSMLVHYTGQYFSEWTSSLLLAIGWILFSSHRTTLSLCLGSLLCAIGLANWPVMLVPIAVVTVIAYLTTLLKGQKDYRFVIFIVSVLIVAVLLLFIELLIKNGLFNNPYLSTEEKGYKTLMPYSGIPGFSYPLLLGILSNLFSFGKSVFLFNPFLIYLFIGNYKYKFYMLVGFLVTLLIYSKWWSWYGGYSFGTRFYIIFVIPSIYVFILYVQKEGLTRKLLGAGVLMLAAWVGICGKYFGMQELSNVCAVNNYSLEAFCWYVLEFSPIISPFIRLSLYEIIDKISMFDWLYLTSIILIYIYISIFSNPSINKVTKL